MMPALTVARLTCGRDNEALIVAIECEVEVGAGFEAVRVSPAEAVELLRTAEPAAVLVGAPVFAGESWPAIHAALDPATPRIAVIHSLADVHALPPEVDDFLDATRTPAEIDARLQHVVRAGRRRREAIQRSEAMSAIGEVVSGVAHDVRNRLFGISATVDAFSSEVGGDPEMAPFFEVLNEEITRLSALLNDLLDYGKASTLNRELGRLRNPIADAIKLAQEYATAAGTSVEVRIEPDTPAVPFDHTRMVRVFHNILMNAIQHAPRGRIVATIGPATRDGREMVVCRVIDTGAGFPRDAIHRVFEPFFTRRAGGVGLGLAIVQRIVEAHRGFVQAVNPASGGAELAVWLPVA